MASSHGSTSGVPVLLVGRSAKTGQTIVDLLTPEYDVVHFCDDIEVAKSEIPSALKGEAIKPKANIGSNYQRPAGHLRLPQVVIVGAGFPDEDFEDLKSAVTLPEGVRWVREQKSDLEDMDKVESWTDVIGLHGHRLPAPHAIAKALRKALKNAGI